MTVVFVCNIGAVTGGTGKNSFRGAVEVSQIIVD